MISGPLRFRASLATEVLCHESNYAFWADESGATAIEYSLLACLIAVVIIGAVRLVGSNLVTMYTVIANNLT
jgi:pilus assembly protein Flp/PilA